MRVVGWTTCPLLDIAVLYQGYGFPKALQGRSTGDLGFYKVSDISRAVIAGSEYLGPAVHCISNEDARGLRATPLPRNAVVFARIGEAINLNRRAFLPAKALIDNNVIGAKARPGIDDRYLLHFLNTVRLGLLSQATTVPAVRTSDIAAIEVSVAPANEQRRIVSKIDELFSRIDEGEQALKRVEELVERYRQSVLKAAVTGELTRDWRAARKRAGEPVESGAALLAHILKARRAAWEAAELVKLKAKGKPPTDDRWKQKYQEPTAPILGTNQSMPDSWACASLEQVTRADRPIAYGVLQPGKDVEGGVPLIRVCDVSDGKVDVDGLKHVAPSIAEVFPRTKLSGGEVVLTLVGSIGRTAVVPLELRDANVARAVGVLVPNVGVSAAWLEISLRSEKVRQGLIDNAREVARKTLNLEQVREYAVPVPPDPEQAAIVAALDERMTELNAVYETVKRNLRWCEALRQSVLRSAFSGQLVPQDPHDEPASKLLERIAAERMAAPTAKRSRRPKATLR